MSVLIILCLITITFNFVTSEMQVHRVFVSRKSSLDSAPIETGYMYKQVNNHPGILSMFSTDTTTTKPILETGQMKKLLSLQYHPIDLTKQTKPESTLMKRDLDNMVAKAESKFLPSKIKTDLMYENLKSAMHYQPDGMNEVVSRFDDYNIDDEDVRTSSRGVYDNWPSYHPSPYEYEYTKLNSEMAKAKDKRYSDSSKIIPIHEDLSHDIPESSYQSYYTTDSYRDMTTENPMTGHDPFFSFVLNDYFDKDNEYDHLSFRDIHWGKDFDVEDYPKRNRRLENNYHLPSDQGITSSHLHRGQNEVEADSVIEKGFNKKHDFTKHEKGDKESTNDKIKHDQNEHKHTEFKDFINTFANKFGTEDNKKDSKYFVRKNQDNGENRKGFHRVYHKDEYMEDKEFYNNNNNSANFEDKGIANAHIGGSEGLQASHAAAALGNQSSNIHKSGDAEKSAFEKNHAGHGANKGYDANFKRYRDVAKQTALSNNADYSDHYRL